MQPFKSSSLACLSSLWLLAQAELSSTTLRTTSATSSQLSSESAHSSFIKKTIAVSHLTQISSTVSMASTSASTSAPTAIVNSTSPDMAQNSSTQSSDGHKTLIIILPTVLGVAAILMIGTIVFMLMRRSSRRRPFSRRTASPLDDKEIDSWRSTYSERKEEPALPSAAILHHKNNSIQMNHSQAWTVSTSPTSTRSPLSPASPPDTPSYLARAPNSRVGLTDETVRGDDPFIPSPKRHATRLSKGSQGHHRTKSMRSSTSAKSVWSYHGGVVPTYEPENLPINAPMRSLQYGKEAGRPSGQVNQIPSYTPASPEVEHVATGLSPRPTKSWSRNDYEIGRAIG